jgi:hypothetical protein
MKKWKVYIPKHDQILLSAIATCNCVVGEDQTLTYRSQTATPISVARILEDVSEALLR